MFLRTSSVGYPSNNIFEALVSRTIAVSVTLFGKYQPSGGYARIMV